MRIGPVLRHVRQDKEKVYEELACGIKLEVDSEAKILDQLSKQFASLDLSQQQYKGFWPEILFFSNWSFLIKDLRKALSSFSLEFFVGTREKWVSP